MLRSTVLLRTLMMVTLAVSLTTPLLPVQAASAQVLGPDSGLYRSPSYGYLMRWDPEQWQVVESSENGRDLLELESETTFVRFSAYDGFDGDPQQCLADASQRLQESDLRSFERGVYEDGRSAEELGDGYAYGAFLIVPRTDQAGTEYVVQIECRTLIQDEAVLEITSVVSSAAYANGADDGTLLIDNVALPRGAYVIQPDVQQLSPTQRTYMNSDADVMLEFSITDHDEAVSDDQLPRPQRGTQWVSVDVQVENTGGSRAEIDATGMPGIDQYGHVIYPTYYLWTEASGDLDRPVQVLEPGDLARMALYYEVDKDTELIAVECMCGPDPDIPITLAPFRPQPYSVFPPPPFHGCNPLGWVGPKILADQSGTEIATVSGTFWGTRGDFQILLAIENSGPDRLTVDSRDFWLVVNESTSYYVDEVTWDLGSDDARRQRVATGEQTLALLSFSIDEEVSLSTQLYYLGPEEDQRQDVASIGVGGGCGGGGRPKIIVGQ